MAKKAKAKKATKTVKKAKTAEERGEEDRQEDQEGRQEGHQEGRQEVSTLLEGRRRASPGVRHTGPRSGLLPTLVHDAKLKPSSQAPVDEGGCRRDIRSNGRIKTFDGQQSSRRTVRQEKRFFFTRCGSSIRGFTGGSPQE